MFSKMLPAVLLLSLSMRADILNPNVVNPALFRVTTFASGLAYPDSIQVLSDGSIAILSSPGYSQSGSILRFTAFNHPGVADGPGTVLYTTSPGPLTGFIRIGKYYALGDFGSHRITLLKEGATPDEPMTAVANLNFNYGSNWEHNTIGIASRPTPGVAGSYDLVFNIGAEADITASTGTVALTGTGFSTFPSSTLKGDSLYAITINETGAVPAASNLRPVARGIRNVFGMAFQSGTGDFYFTDNAMDMPLTNGEPPQADELNFISVANFSNGTPPNFGFPTCYIQYVTGTPIGSGCVQPLQAFQPIPDTFSGAELEGPTEMAFAPKYFPSGFNNGIFVGFNGEGIGKPTDEAGMGYYDFSLHHYVHFIESSNPEIGNIIGVTSTSDSLFVSDFSKGNVYEITRVLELARADFATGVSPRAIAVADFNGDGKPDLAISNYNAASVSILIGNGDGTFQPHKDYATASLPIAIAAADFNGDGKLDLAVADFGSNLVSILLGNGDGTFRKHLQLDAQLQPASIAVGDFNRDGRPDLAVANYGSNTVTVLYGNGDGTFHAHNNLSVGSAPLSVAFADVNDDGNLDLIVSNLGSNTISVLLGHGNGAFDSQVTFATGASPRALVLADFNGDGKLDVAVSDYTANAVSVLFGNGNGTFQPHDDYATALRPFSLVAADLNGDGKPDLAVVDTNCSPSCAANGYVSVLFNNGNGTFQTHQDFATGSQPVAVAAGDFRDNGKLGLAIPDFHSNSVSILLQ